jgi:hypothetical protein
MDGYDPIQNSDELLLGFGGGAMNVQTGNGPSQDEQVPTPSAQNSEIQQLKDVGKARINFLHREHKQGMQRCSQVNMQTRVWQQNSITLMNCTESSLWSKFF